MNKINKKDIIIIGLVLLSALVIWAWRFLPSSKATVAGVADSSTPRADITYNGEIVKAVDLTEDKVFSLNGLSQVVFEIKDGGIAFQSSDCPDQICVLQGALTIPGDFAACIPNRVMVQVKSDDGGGVDIVVK